jgi:C-terminal processing protease CtpA/Prc
MTGKKLFPFCSILFLMLFFFSLSCNHNYNEGTKIIINNLNNQKIENLSILCRIWGFLKYYHPYVAKGIYNWDNKLFDILPKIIECNNRKERNEILYDWIGGLGAVEYYKKLPDTNKSNIKTLPDLDWLNDREMLGEKLSDQLIFIKENPVKGKKYYVSYDDITYQLIFHNENPYIDISSNDTGYRILTFFRYWNIIQYFYPFKYSIRKDWKNIPDEYIPKFINASDELQYKLAILELINEIHDSHAKIWQRDTILENYYGKYGAAFQVKFIEEQAVVTEFYDKELGERTTLKKGDIISKIDGLSVEEIVKTRLPITPASNKPTQLAEIARYLLFGKTGGSGIEYIRDNKINKTVIERYSPDKLNTLPFFYKKQAVSNKFIKNNIGYIYPATFKNEEIIKVMKQFKKTKGIIIDLRCYPGKFSITRLCWQFLPERIKWYKYTYPDIEYPGLFRWSEIKEIGQTNSEYYKGKIIIIVNELTFSLSEFYAMAFRLAPRALIIGSTTAAASGWISTISLPGGIKTMISAVGYYYPDGRETQQVGIIPDIEVKPTIKGIKEGRDELLEKAIEIIEKY